MQSGHDDGERTPETVYSSTADIDVSSYKEDPSMKGVFVLLGAIGILLLVVGVIILALYANGDLDPDRLLKDGTKRYGYELLVNRINGFPAFFFLSLSFCCL